MISCASLTSGGSAKIIQVYESTINLKDGFANRQYRYGVGYRGIYMASDVYAEECMRLARSITLKNVAVGLSHEGGKTVVYADSKMSKSGKERLIWAMAGALRNFLKSIISLDIGIGEECMAWIKGEIKHSIIGLLAEARGIPINQIGTTA